jgi:hypothetical protein
MSKQSEIPTVDYHTPRVCVRRKLARMQKTLCVIAAVAGAAFLCMLYFGAMVLGHTEAFARVIIEVLEFPRNIAWTLFGIPIDRELTFVYLAAIGAAAGAMVMLWIIRRPKYTRRREIRL